MVVQDVMRSAKALQTMVADEKWTSGPNALYKDVRQDLLMAVHDVCCA